MKASFIILLTITAVLIYRDLTCRLYPPTKAAIEDKKGDDDAITNEAAEVLTGTVVQYGSNRAGDIDKILLHTSKARIWLHFPPHTASRVLDIATRNTVIKAAVDGEDGDEPGGEPRDVLSIESVKGEKKIVIADIPPPAPSQGLPIEISGSSIKFQIDDHGHIAGFILSGKLVELKPKAAETILPLLQQAKSIAVKGIARSTQAGFVNNNGLVLVKPVSITIDNVNYIVQ